MGVCAACFLLFQDALPQIWTDKPAVLAIASSLLPVAAAFQICDGLQVVAIGVLRGLGDLRTPAITGLVGFWIIGFPAGLLLAFRAEMGPRGLWWGLVMGLTCFAIILAARTVHRLKAPLHRLHIEESDAV
jgi:MATE family multidrug resistance protein